MPFPSNLTAIDQISRPDHFHLKDNDRCAFLGEYTARRGYGFSDTNRLILNLKKTVDRRGSPEWRYKVDAIRSAGRALRNSIANSWLDSATFVPIPPSRVKTDPMYDDRILQVLQQIRIGNPVDWRELVIQTENTEAAHDLNDRPGPNEIYRLYEINETRCDPEPEKIIITDDVLTTGAHFKAAQRLLFERFGEIPIVGIFIARRVPEALNV